MPSDRTILINGVLWYIRCDLGNGLTLICRSENGLPPGPCCREDGAEWWCNAWRCAAATQEELKGE